MTKTNNGGQFNTSTNRESLISCQVTLHLPTDGNWKHGNILISYTHYLSIEKTVWQPQVWEGMFYSLSPDILELLFIETICREHGNWPQQAEATNP